MRKALDEVGEEVGRYIRLCNYCSGLCMPEIAVMGALEGLDVMLNDACTAFCSATSTCSARWSINICRA